MHVPRYSEINKEKALEFIKSFNLGIVISVADQVHVTPLPFLTNGKILMTHIAKNNPHSKVIEGAVKVVFNGPESYISSSVYTSPEVPSWNYTSVHVNGTARLVRDDKKVHKHLIELTEHFEERYAPGEKFTLDKIPEPRIMDMMRRIEMVEIEIEEVVGKFKLSQNRSSKDIENIINYLDNGDHRMRELAAFMRAESRSVVDNE